MPCVCERGGAVLSWVCDLSSEPFPWRGPASLVSHRNTDNAAVGQTSEASAVDFVKLLFSSVWE